VSHCIASYKPLMLLRKAQQLQTVLQHASVHGLRLWLHGITLPLLLSSQHPAVLAAPPLPAWYTAAVTVMDADAARQVLLATAAAAAAVAAGLVSRSDAALIPPCAASAARWYHLSTVSAFSFSFRHATPAAPPLINHRHPHRMPPLFIPSQRAQGTPRCDRCGRLRARHDDLRIIFSFNPVSFPHQCRQEAWASAALADVLAHLRCAATNALVM
jgi:hypothetical protein